MNREENKMIEYEIDYRELDAASLFVLSMRYGRGIMMR